MGLLGDVQESILSGSQFIRSTDSGKNSASTLQPGLALTEVVARVAAQLIASERLSEGQA